MQRKGLVRNPFSINILQKFPPSADGTILSSNGADGIRTHDLRIANATLSQLSYGPMVLAGMEIPG